jgi:hypothetical protein
MKISKCLNVTTALVLLSVPAIGSLDAAVTQTVKGPRITLAAPRPPHAAGRAAGMTPANCPMSSVEPVVRRYQTDSKGRRPAVIRAGVEQTMKNCRRQLVRAASGGTRHLMTGCRS